jgi:hypothetical protein
LEGPTVLDAHRADRVITVRIAGSAIMRADNDVWGAPVELRLALDDRCLDAVVLVAGKQALLFASDATDVVAAWRAIAHAVQDHDDALPCSLLAAD